MESPQNEKKVKLIKNPLPLPKKHEKREMEYDFEVKPEQMHFDIEHPEKNYYDI